jgi:hypothetical protein
MISIYVPDKIKIKEFNRKLDLERKKEEQQNPTDQSTTDTSDTEDTEDTED